MNVELAHLSRWRYQFETRKFTTLGGWLCLGVLWFGKKQTGKKLPNKSARVHKQDPKTLAVHNNQRWLHISHKDLLAVYTRRVGQCVNKCSSEFVGSRKTTKSPVEEVCLHSSATGPSKGGVEMTSVLCLVIISGSFVHPLSGVPAVSCSDQALSK